uniref:TRP C-terminal domain-containing protein n=1 Tax=Chromera velia CCMP2878 TaxID=1169474 RepID=A0A0G4IFS3_9ALVE|eukprot:Cvel_2499.t1-p1 / transcript=Cvel_2499.t1 / gene=Cvel_2499 / organism=Chromera_velia_CCMP2878 / gene_product=hypothetical protein / transcript_product=hypothetical protein / location=Cvel_scaffold98:59915-67070(+) / protein_length=474 / sequence_SO=supercontig / SO=protein_coding / is_pseudo=false
MKQNRDRDACLGGPLSSLGNASVVSASSAPSSLSGCKGKRIGFVCDECPLGYFKNNDDDCSLCSGNFSWPFFVLFVGCLLVVIFLYYNINGRYTPRWAPLSAAITAATLTIVFMQVEHFAFQLLGWFAIALYIVAVMTFVGVVIFKVPIWNNVYEGFGVRLNNLIDLVQSSAYMFLCFIGIAYSKQTDRSDSALAIVSVTVIVAGGVLGLGVMARALIALWLKRRTAFLERRNVVRVAGNTLRAAGLLVKEAQEMNEHAGEEHESEGVIVGEGVSPWEAKFMDLSKQDMGTLDLFYELAMQELVTFAGLLHHRASTRLKTSRRPLIGADNHELKRGLSSTRKPRATFLEFVRHDPEAKGEEEEEAYNCNGSQGNLKNSERGSERGASVDDSWAVKEEGGEDGDVWPQLASRKSKKEGSESHNPYLPPPLPDTPLDDQELEAEYDSEGDQGDSIVGEIVVEIGDEMGTEEAIEGS